MRCLYDKLHQWYFKKGGLFVSTGSKEAFYRLFDYFERLKESQPRSATSRTVTADELPDSVSEELLKRATRLRSRITNDIGAHRKSVLGEPRDMSKFIWTRK
jgi:hypothetical protein